MKTFLFLIDIIIISILVLSFATFIYLYLHPQYSISKLKRKVEQGTCNVPISESSSPSCSSGTSSGSNSCIKKEVYNLANNVYTYPMAKNACAEFDGELATKEQLQESWDEGANWCNYGWSKGQNAYYPIQGTFWSQLQADPNLMSACGNIGLNGGYFKDTNLKFGVNCYGIKPEPPKDKNFIHASILDLVNPRSTSDDKSDKMKHTNIMPFNEKGWSVNDSDTNKK